MKDVIEQSKQLNTRIKQSAEYRKYLDTKRVLYDNKELYNQLRDFRNRNNAIQAKQSGDIFDEMNGSNLSMKSVVKKKKKWKKFVLIFLTLVFIVVLVYSLLKILFWFKDNMDMSSVIKEISENIEVEEVIDDENTELVNEEEDELSDYWYYITLLYSSFYSI